MAHKLLEGMHRQIIQGDEFEVKTIYSVSGKTKNISGKGIITSRVDFYTKSLDPSHIGSIQLHEAECFSNPAIPNEALKIIPNCNDPSLRKAVQEILVGKFPDHLINAYLIANVDFGGHNLFIKGFGETDPYDRNKTLGPVFKEFARGLVYLLDL